MREFYDQEWSNVGEEVSYCDEEFGEEDVWYLGGSSEDVFYVFEDCADSRISDYIQDWPYAWRQSPNFIDRQFILGMLVGVLFAVFISTRLLVDFFEWKQTEYVSVLSNDVLSTDCEVNDRFPEKILQWCHVITQNARLNNLSPNLIATIIWLESGGDPLAYSHSGAVGLMQIMPRDGIAEKFNCVNGPCFKDRPTINELYNPEFNVAYGAQFLAGILRRSGDLREALRQYGPMDVGYMYADQVLDLYLSHEGDAQ